MFSRCLHTHLTFKRVYLIYYRRNERNRQGSVGTRAHHHILLIAAQVHPSFIIIIEFQDVWAITLISLVGVVLTGWFVFFGSIATPRTWWILRKLNRRKLVCAWNVTDSRCWLVQFCVKSRGCFSTTVSSPLPFGRKVPPATVDMNRRKQSPFE